MDRIMKQAAGDTAYLDEITMMLRDQLRQVIRIREPRVLSVIDDPAGMVPFVESPDAMSIIVVGGAGKHSSWQPRSVARPGR